MSNPERQKADLVNHTLYKTLISNFIDKETKIEDVSINEIVAGVYGFFIAIIADLEESTLSGDELSKRLSASLAEDVAEIRAKREERKQKSGEAQAKIADK